MLRPNSFSVAAALQAVGEGQQRTVEIPLHDFPAGRGGTPEDLRLAATGF